MNQRINEQSISLDSHNIKAGGKEHPHFIVGKTDSERKGHSHPHLGEASSPGKNFSPLERAAIPKGSLLLPLPRMGVGIKNEGVGRAEDCRVGTEALSLVLRVILAQ